MDEWLYVEGVFDLVHAGHFNAMRQAAQLLPALCVGVNDDDDVLVSKGTRPILPNAERAFIIAACKWVDRVIVRTPYVTSLAYLLDYARCGTVAHGDDAVSTTAGVDCYAEPRAAGRFRVFHRTEGISSTAITARLRAACADVGLLSRHREPAIDAPLPVTAPLSTHRLRHFLSSGKGKGRRAPIEDPASRNETTTAADDFDEASPGAADDAYAPASPSSRIIYTQGAFDILRADQVAFLEAARARGSKLIVGIYRDDVCAALDPENAHAPILSANDRMMNVLALFCVDDAICNVDWELSVSLLKAHNVDEVVLPSDSPRIQALKGLARKAEVGTTVLPGYLTVNDLRPTLMCVAENAPTLDASLLKRHVKDQLLATSRHGMCNEL